MTGRARVNRVQEFSDAEQDAMLVAICGWVPARSADAIAQAVLDALYSAGWKLVRDD